MLFVRRGVVRSCDSSTFLAGSHESLDWHQRQVGARGRLLRLLLAGGCACCLHRLKLAGERKHGLVRLSALMDLRDDGFLDRACIETTDCLQRILILSLLKWFAEQFLLLLVPCALLVEGARCQLSHLW